jgi:cysteine-rich repeat protein
MNYVRSLAVVFALCVLLPAPAPADEEVRAAGPEFRVSRGHGSYYTYDGTAYNPDVARSPNGEFVVVWEELVENYAGYSYSRAYRVAAKRFNRNGTGKGQQFKVFQQSNEYASRAFHPAVATTPQNGFVVVWSNYADEAPANYQGRVWAQRYNANNNPLAAKAQVNATALAGGYIGRNDVATDSQGGFLVVWDGWFFDPNPDAGAAVAARRFDAAGQALGTEFQVNTSSLGCYGYPGTAANAQDDFVVVWQNICTTGNVAPEGFFAQQLDAGGAPVGAEITVNTLAQGEESKNHVAIAPGGEFLAPNWVGQLTVSAFDAGGAPVTGVMTIDPAGDYPSVAADPDGNFVVVWHRQGGADDQAIYGRRFSAAGTPLGSEFKVTEQPQYYRWDWPEVATDEDGDFVVVWANGYYGYVDGTEVDLIGIWGRRFGVCGNGRIGPDDVCDDGNAGALDGCSPTCRVETCHACSGEPSSCPPIGGCSVVCTDGAPIDTKAVMTFKKLGAPLGDEGFVFKGKIVAPPLAPGEYAPSSEGMEIALHTQDLVYARAVPPGLVGGGCDVKDGWKVRPSAAVYKNVSGALPPGCAPGSANGLRTVKVKDRLAKDGTMQVRVKARNATIPTVPAPPLQASIVLGQSPAAGAAGHCGQITFSKAVGSRFFP